MKKIFHPLLAVIILLMTACSESGIDDEEEPGNKNLVLQKKIESIVSSEILERIKDLGMPVYTGETPPIIEGSYLLDSQTMKKTNIEDDDPVGTKYVDEVLTLSNQDNKNFSITLKSEFQDYTNTFNMIISGKDDKFTLYGNFTIELDDGSKVKAVIIFSGIFKNGELHDLHFGEFIIDKPFEGLGHIMYESDKIAKVFSGDIGDGEEIQVPGETANGKFSGSDLIFKFNTGEKISILAKNNAGAPHEDIVVTKSGSNSIFNLGKNILFDFSKTKSQFTVNFETTIEKDLDPDEDIDCSLFTRDPLAIEMTDGKVFKNIDFNYDKSTGKLSFTFVVNEPLTATKSSRANTASPAIGFYNELNVSIAEKILELTSTKTMKAPYEEQIGETCWAACAMMFIRSYKKQEHGIENGMLSLVKELGHKDLSQGWNTNFIAWESETSKISKSIKKRINPDIEVKSSSFRLMNSAANEMIKLLKERKPVILNYGTHVVFVIGYKKEVGNKGDAIITFLFHDPQGGAGDMYKWVVWDKLMKDIKFKERLLLGDILYIIYANKPMIDNPSLQTLASPIAEDVSMYPVGTDLSFTMNAYGKARKLFPKYNQNSYKVYDWSKQGYDEANSENDTIYEPVNMKVQMRVFNADDKPVNMRLEMNIAGGGYFYSNDATFTSPANSIRNIKYDEFKDTENQTFNPTLQKLVQDKKIKDISISFALVTAPNYSPVEELYYDGIVLKPVAEEEPAEFKAFRPILKDIYTSITGKDWSDSFVWLTKDSSVEWGYQISTQDILSFMISAGSTYDNKPYFQVWIRENNSYTKKMVVGNHTLPGEWKWALDCSAKVSEIEINNDYIRDFSASKHINKLILSAKSSPGIDINKTGSSNNDLTIDVKQSEIGALYLRGVESATINTMNKISGVNVLDSEGGTLTITGSGDLNAIDIAANKFKLTGNQNKLNGWLTIGNKTTISDAKFIVSGFNLYMIDERSSDVGMKKLTLNNVSSSKIKYDTFGRREIELIDCPNLIEMHVDGNSITSVELNDSNCPNFSELRIWSESLEDFKVNNGITLDKINIYSLKMGGAFNTWPEIMRKMYNSGKGKGILVTWRFSYKKECDENGKNCKYVLDTDRGYGFYFDTSEPGSFDIEKYNKVGHNYQ